MSITITITDTDTGKTSTLTESGGLIIREALLAYAEEMDEIAATVKEVEEMGGRVHASSVSLRAEAKDARWLANVVDGGDPAEMR